MSAHRPPRRRRRTYRPLRRRRYTRTHTHTQRVHKLAQYTTVRCVRYVQQKISLTTHTYTQSAHPLHAQTHTHTSLSHLHTHSTRKALRSQVDVLRAERDMLKQQVEKQATRLEGLMRESEEAVQLRRKARESEATIEQLAAASSGADDRDAIIGQLRSTYLLNVSIYFSGKECCGCVMRSRLRFCLWVFCVCVCEAHHKLRVIP